MTTFFFVICSLAVEVTFRPILRVLLNGLGCGRQPVDHDALQSTVLCVNLPVQNLLIFCPTCETAE
jgi:hypothetical protein